jgi:hypothetical protein
MRRWRFFTGLRADGLFGAGEAVGEALDVATQTIKLLPLRGDRGVEILDRPLVVGDADFEFFDAGLVLRGLGHGQVFMTAAGAMLQARP